MPAKLGVFQSYSIKLCGIAMGHVDPIGIPQLYLSHLFPLYTMCLPKPKFAWCVHMRPWTSENWVFQWVANDCSGEGPEPDTRAPRYLLLVRHVDRADILHLAQRTAIRIPRGPPQTSRRTRSRGGPPAGRQARDCAAARDPARVPLPPPTCDIATASVAPTSTGSAAACGIDTYHGGS